MQRLSYLKRFASAVVLWSLLLPIFFSVQLQAAAVDTLVLAPEASGPAEKIYNQVVSGVESNSGLKTRLLTIPSDSDETWLEKEIARYQPELVVPIGNKSYKLCDALSQRNALPIQTQVIAGGISGKPNGIPTLSLTGSPAETMGQLKRVAPDVRDIHLVYNDELNGWWYREAMEVASSFDMKVIGYRADDLQQGVKLYSKMVNEAKKKTSAIWIPLKSIVPSKTILPLVLEKAWAKKMPVISNNPSHTRLGSLMAVYPNHYSMGQQLAEFALKYYRGNDQRAIKGTRDLKTAINVRTGAHLGLRLDESELERFDKVFPTMR